ncbi:MAG: (d)CMP kinase [Acidimicrobiia bacterium]
MTSAVITVDGPAGSGKSTVSRAVAERLGWRHLDTGAYYRAATVAAIEAGADVSDEEAVISALTGRDFDQVGGAMLLDGRDISVDIRSEGVTGAVSAVAAHPRVRRLMVELQREWTGQRTGAVVEGRDIGTVVFPDAEVKVFLTADPAERARRRAVETGHAAEAVATAIERRDLLDSTRQASPLRPADDAIVIDTTDLGIDQVVELIIEAVSAL